MEDKKLVFVALNTRNTEMSYIPVEIFSKLMSNGFIRWDGLWIQDARLWFIFFDPFNVKRWRVKWNYQNVLMVY